MNHHHCDSMSHMTSVSSWLVFIGMCDSCSSWLVFIVTHNKVTIKTSVSSWLVFIGMRHSCSSWLVFIMTHVCPRIHESRIPNTVESRTNRSHGQIRELCPLFVWSRLDITEIMSYMSHKVMYMILPNIYESRTNISHRQIYASCTRSLCVPA